MQVKRHSLDVVGVCSPSIGAVLSCDGEITKEVDSRIVKALELSDV